MTAHVIPNPAASVIPVREHEGRAEVLLVKRNAAIAFLGDTWVFPGGKIDPVDQAGSEDLTARRAAARELEEETNLSIEASALLPFSHWTTPLGGQHRYATWFYLGLPPEPGSLRVDGSEIVDACWDSAESLLSRQAQGELRLSAPAFVSLQALCDWPVDALTSANAFLPEYIRFRPRLVKVDGGQCALYEGDAGYEGQCVDTPGPRHRLWMITQGWRYERG